MHQLIESRLEAALDKRKQEGNLRTLRVETGLLDFYSNDYLGYAASAELQLLIGNEIAAHPGVPTGSGGSRLLAGNSAYAMNLETELAAYYGFPASLLFNSGFDANLALLPCVAGRTDTIIYDELVHASIHAGIRLSNAHCYKFLHNDSESLRSKIRLGTGNIFVVVESLYSMDGDLAPLAEIARICQEEGAALIVDEAHSTGVFGPDGTGLVSELGLQPSVFAVLHTYGKAMGTHGSTISGSAVLKDFLINFARPFIYSTALPFHTLACIRMAVQHAADSSDARVVLMANIAMFRKLLHDNGIEAGAPGPVQSLLLGRNERCKNASSMLAAAGFNIRAILSPTVAPGAERLRICLHAFNSKADIERLAELLPAL